MLAVALASLALFSRPQCRTLRCETVAAGSFSPLACIVTSQYNMQVISDMASRRTFSVRPFLMQLCSSSYVYISRKGNFHWKPAFLGTITAFEVLQKNRVVEAGNSTSVIVGL